MTASTQPPMPNKSFLGTAESVDAYNELCSWAEACRADRDALDGKLRRVHRLLGDLSIVIPICDPEKLVSVVKHIIESIGLPDSSNSQGQEGG